MVSSSVIGTIISMRCLSEFLHAEELQRDATKRIEKTSLSMGDEVLSIKSAEFAWTKKDVQPVLEDINLTVRRGELVGIWAMSVLERFEKLLWHVGGIILEQGPYNVLMENPDSEVRKLV